MAARRNWGRPCQLAAGMALYESSDFGEHTAMKESAGMMCDGPRHQLHRDDIILVVDPAEAVQLLYGTLWNVTAAVVHGNVETTWGPEDEASAAPRATLIRKFGVQAQSLRGAESSQCCLTRCTR